MFYLGKRKYDNGDFESAKNLVSSDVCSFGTKVDLVTNLNDLETQQWQKPLAKKFVPQKCILNLQREFFVVHQLQLSLG